MCDLITRPKNLMNRIPHILNCLHFKLCDAIEITIFKLINNENMKIRAGGVKVNLFVTS